MFKVYNVSFESPFEAYVYFLHQGLVALRATFESLLYKLSKKYFFVIYENDDEETPK